MISSVAQAFIGLIGAFIATLVIKDLIWLQRSLTYLRQGIPVRYFPFIGFVKYLESHKKDHCFEDFYQLFRKRKNNNQSEKLILMNGPSPKPIIFLNDQDLVNEFHKKEIEVSCVHNLVEFPAKNSLSFSRDPHRVQRDRAIFAEIFYPENLKKNTPQIRKIVQKHIDLIKNEIKESGVEDLDGTQKAEIELKPHIRNIFTDMVSFLLFGGEIPDVDGAKIVDQIKAVIRGYFNNYKSPLNIVTLGLSTKLGLNFEFNKVTKLYKKIIDKLKEVVRERENTKGYQFGSNAVDLLILKNRELEAQGKTDQMMTYDQIAENIFIIIFGGMDTSRNLTESALYKVSSDTELQKKLRKAVKEEVLDTGRGEDYHKYDNSPLLDAFVKEALRLYSPISFTIHRKVTKKFKLGPYTINRGDFVVVSLTTLQTKPELFNKSTKFDLGKYEEKKRIRELSKSALIPFSAGKRNCIGKNLADLMIKLILCNFLDQFELEKSGEPNRRILELALALKHCKARLRVTRREESS